MNVHSYTVWDIFRRNARLSNEKTALVWGGERVSFGELCRSSETIAGNLFELGIKKGDRIAILAQNNKDYFSLFGAAAALGTVLVPINWRSSTQEILHIMNDSKPSVLFVDEEFIDTISSLENRFISLEKYYVFGDEKTGFIPFSSLLEPSSSFDHNVKEEEPYLIIYTAATDGKAKGVVLSHGNLVFCGLQTICIMGLSSDDVYLNILPLFHVAGVFLALSVMYAGGKNVIVSGFDAQEALHLTQQEDVTLIGDFPPILKAILDAQNQNPCDISSLKHVLGVDSPETIVRLEKETAGGFWLSYGQSETTGSACLCRNSEKPGSAGKPGFLTDIRIVDNQERAVSPGRTGEILVRGPLVFQGYLRQGELNVDTFKNGWHHTGDLGRLDEDGYLWFMGRKPEKELIKSGGENVYPAEVEQVILEHPHVQDVVVVGMLDSKFGQGIRAICVRKPGTELSQNELIDFVGGRIARYKRPKSVIFLDSMPKLENGTIDREGVKKSYGDAAAKRE